METAYIAIGAALVYAACAAAAVGAFLPVLPGPLLSFAAIFAFKLALPDSQLGWWNVGICGALAALAQAADIFMSWMGAKKFGATWRGGLGAFVGVFVGIFLPPPVLWCPAVDFYRAIGRGVPRRMARGIGFARFGQGGVGGVCGLARRFNAEIFDRSLHGFRVFSGSFWPVLKIFLTPVCGWYLYYGFNLSRA